MEQRKSESFENKLPISICGNCHLVINGSRFKCVQCPDFDGKILCSSCIQRGSHSGHAIVHVGFQEQFFASNLASYPVASSCSWNLPTSIEEKAAEVVRAKKSVIRVSHNGIHRSRTGLIRGGMRCRGHGRLSHPLQRTIQNDPVYLPPPISMLPPKNSSYRSIIPSSSYPSSSLSQKTLDLSFKVLQQSVRVLDKSLNIMQQSGPQNGISNSASNPNLPSFSNGLSKDSTIFVEKFEAALKTIQYKSIAGGSNGNKFHSSIKLSPASPKFPFYHPPAQPGMTSFGRPHLLPPPPLIQSLNPIIDFHLNGSGIITTSRLNNFELPNLQSFSELATEDPTDESTIQPDLGITVNKQTESQNSDATMNSQENSSQETETVAEQLLNLSIKNDVLEDDDDLPDFE